MLQQTRVEAFRPYFDRFLEKFPTFEALAAAPEPDVLAAWSGLGYYSRARNVHKSAKKIVVEGIPATYNAVLALPGIGAYTAAAVSSISLGLPHAAVDGNVLRVISRLDNDSSEITAAATQRRIAARAQVLLSNDRPGDFNQAMMELGATVCTPRNPACPVCPVAGLCQAKAAGTQNEIPVKLKKAVVQDVSVDLLVLERNAQIFLVQRAEDAARLAGFWELPERASLQRVRARRTVNFTHQIVNDRMRIAVWYTAEVPADLPPGKWLPVKDIREIPVSTVSRKSLERLFPSELS